MHIDDAQKEKGSDNDRRRIHISEPIKETRENTESVRLHREVNVEIPVTVTGEGGAQTAGAAAPEPAAAGAPAPGDGPDDDTAEAAEA
jgi:hypothetical protein